MNSELVFSVKNIFSEYLTKTSGSSGQIYNYHIPAYQRGYKWSSDPNGAVSILLNDLAEAYFDTYSLRINKMAIGFLSHI